MITILRSVYKCHSILKLKTICQNHILTGDRTSLHVLIENYQPASQIHTSVVWALTKKQRLAEELRQREYISPRKRKKVIEIWEGMTIEELAKAMEKDIDHVLEIMTYCHNTADYDSPHDVLPWAVLVDILKKANLRHKSKEKEHEKEEDRDEYPLPPADETKLKPRPPVVTIMGHVDHGKTTLLDYLRKSSIVKSEFGGITQHIGAFSVKVKSGSITFLDTPGHAAFKAMRSRGAHCTDIVVLVVAADDGVMEQTEESIRMARQAQVPIIVAINKIDKQDADVNITKQMLAAQGLIPEDLGGDIQCVPISALKGTNIDALTEVIVIQAELEKFSADPESRVEGVIIESKVDSHRGKLATALIRQGTLKKNCFLTAGVAWGKVKVMYNEYHEQIHEAPPSTPVEVVGWRELPNPGDIILEVKSERRAHQVTEFRAKKAAEEKARLQLETIDKKRQKHLEEYRKKMLERKKLGVRSLRPGPRQKEAEITWEGPILSVIIKTDVEGSLEALLDTLYTYFDPRCKLDIVHGEVGSVSIGDVELAEAFSAVIYNFNGNVLPDAYIEAERKKVEIRFFNIIYKFIEDVKKEINSRIPPKELERVTAEAVVQQLFLVTDVKKKNVPVAGCRCTVGDLKKNAMYKVLRDGVEIHRGQLSSMRNLKTEVTSVKKDQECGLRFQDTTVIFKPNDVIQSYETYKVPEEVNWNPY